jgi:hypothetical protein
MSEEKLTQEGDKVIGGLLSLEELDNFQYVRSEFTTPFFKPKMTIEYKDMRFSASCVRLFPDTEYIQLLADDSKNRLLAWPCNEHSKDSIKWSLMKSGVPTSRNIRTRVLCAKLFKMMSWNIHHRYKVMAVYQEIKDLRLIVFNLEECEMYVIDDSPSPDGIIRLKRKVIYPVDWENSFGTPYAEHKATYDIDIDSYHILSNSKDGDTKENVALEPRLPTSSEIITREYYTPDEVEKGGSK